MCEVSHGVLARALRCACMHVAGQKMRARRLVAKRQRPTVGDARESRYGWEPRREHGLAPRAADCTAVHGRNNYYDSPPKIDLYSLRHSLIRANTHAHEEIECQYVMIMLDPRQIK